MSKIIRKGKYTKIFYKDETYLTFIPSVEEFDAYYKAYEEIKKITNTSGDWAFQCCSEEEEKKYFNNLLFISYSYYGEILDALLFKFDFKNQKVTIGEKTYKIKDDKEVIYGIQKTQIKAKGGAEGLYKFLVRENNINSAYLNLCGSFKYNSKITIRG